MMSCGTDQPALLLAEDEPIIAAHLLALLTEMGVANIHSVATVQEANEIADHQIIDLALLDLNLADGSSLALAKRLCSKRVAVIVMTGTSDFVLPRECHRALILVKPFSLRQLEKLMMGFLPQSGTHSPLGKNDDFAPA
jgi:DNA-binding response OmpR family regulator